MFRLDMSPKDRAILQRLVWQAGRADNEIAGYMLAGEWIQRLQNLQPVPQEPDLSPETREVIEKAEAARSDA